MNPLEMIKSRTNEQKFKKTKKADFSAFFYAFRFITNQYKMESFHFLVLNLHHIPRYKSDGTL
jgi:hypothetical protein